MSAALRDVLLSKKERAHLKTIAAAWGYRRAQTQPNYEALMQHVGSHALSFTDALMRNADQLGNTDQRSIFGTDAWELADRADGTLAAFGAANDPLYATMGSLVAAYLDNGGAGHGPMRAAVQKLAGYTGRSAPRQFLGAAARLVLAVPEGRDALVRERAAMRAAMQALRARE